MGRWDEKFSEEQRRAVGSFILDPDPVTGKKRTAKQALEALHAGRLGIPAPGEPMSISMAYECKRREQARRRGTELSPLAKQALEDPETIRGNLIQRAVSVQDYQLQELEDQQRRHKVDPRLYSMVIKNMPTVLGLLRKPTSHTNKGKPPVDENGERPDDTNKPDELDALVTAHQTTARGATWATSTAGQTTDSAAR